MLLLLKIIIAPVLIGLVSLAGRKWGPGVAGWLLGFPLNAAPILLFITLQQGQQFASTAAYGSLLGLIAWAVFCLVYAICSAKWPWWASMLVGFAAYLAIAGALLHVHLNLGWSFVMVVASITIIFSLFPKPAQNQPVKGHRKYELLLRMGTATAMVLALTGTASALGPQRSGILTVFPAYTTILAVFSHFQSAASAVRVLRGVTLGLYTMSVFCMTLSVFLSHLHTWLAFTLALAISGVVQGISLLLMRRERQAI